MLCQTIIFRHSSTQALPDCRSRIKSETARLVVDDMVEEYIRIWLGVRSFELHRGALSATARVANSVSLNGVYRRCLGHV